MSMYEIQGGRPLNGRLRVQGAKNSVLPLLAGSRQAPYRSGPGAAAQQAAAEHQRGPSQKNRVPFPETGILRGRAGNE